MVWGGFMSATAGNKSDGANASVVAAHACEPRAAGSDGERSSPWRVAGKRQEREEISG